MNLKLIQREEVASIYFFLLEIGGRIHGGSRRDFSQLTNEVRSSTVFNASVGLRVHVFIVPPRAGRDKWSDRCSDQWQLH
jgi:hypothetical protein